MRRRTQDRGTASLEVISLVPLLVLVAMLAFQLAVAGWTASQTADAARVAARANSLGQNAGTAARNALPGRLDVESLAVGTDRVTLTVAVPRVSVLPTFHVTRSVAIPQPVH